jgi:hypothetical protein
LGPVSHETGSSAPEKGFGVGAGLSERSPSTSSGVTGHSAQPGPDLARPESPHGNDAALPTISAETVLGPLPRAFASAVLETVGGAVVAPPHGAEPGAAAPSPRPELGGLLAGATPSSLLPGLGEIANASGLAKTPPTFGRPADVGGAGIGLADAERAGKPDPKDLLSHDLGRHNGH